MLKLHLEWKNITKYLFKVIDVFIRYNIVENSLNEYPNERAIKHLVHYTLYNSNWKCVTKHHFYTRIYIQTIHLQNALFSNSIRTVDFHYFSRMQSPRRMNDSNNSKTEIKNCSRYILMTSKNQLYWTTSP